jgi:hypothetical protein
LNSAVLQVNRIILPWQELFAWKWNMWQWNVLLFDVFRFTKDEREQKQSSSKLDSATIVPPLAPKQQFAMSANIHCQVNLLGSPWTVDQAEITWSQQLQEEEGSFEKETAMGGGGMRTNRRSAVGSLQSH